MTAVRLPRGHVMRRLLVAVMRGVFGLPAAYVHAGHGAVIVARLGSVVAAMAGFAGMTALACLKFFEDVLGSSRA
jgi:hypothetical protein